MIIGIVGKKGSGKDTLANYLWSYYGHKKYAFADPLKHGLVHIFGFTYDQLWGDEKEDIDERWGVSPREILQIFGTEIFQYAVPKSMPNLKSGNREFWVKRFEIWLDNEKNVIRAFNQLSNDSNVDHLLKVVISDIRFNHESNKIKELGGMVIKIERNIIDNEYSDHSSETELDDITYDHIITNNGTIEELHNKIYNIIGR